MRDYKFRVWDIEKKTFVNDVFIQNNKCYTLDSQNKGLIHLDNVVISPYVGVTDENKIELYEGDIAKDEDGNVYVVEWSSYSAGWVFYDFINEDTYDNRDMCIIWKIGNKYESPELLDKKQYNF